MELTEISDNIFVINKFLTELECLNFINEAEIKGFQKADVDIGHGRSHLSHIRNNDRLDWQSEELALTWWNKLPSDDFPIFFGKKAISLSPYFRFYRYQLGQKFNMHKDGRQKVFGNTTMMTMLVYLNNDYEGGLTKFRQDDIEINADIGQALIFEHHLWHQSTRLLAGSKYILRTDIVFG